MPGDASSALVAVATIGVIWRVPGPGSSSHSLRPAIQSGFTGQRVGGCACDQQQVTADRAPFEAVEIARPEQNQAYSRLPIDLISYTIGPLFAAERGVT